MMALSLSNRLGTYLDLLLADGAGGLDGVGALVAELGHRLTGHQLKGSDGRRNAGSLLRVVGRFRHQQEVGELGDLLLL